MLHPSEPCHSPMGSDHYRSSSSEYIYLYNYHYFCSHSGVSYGILPARAIGCCTEELQPPVYRSCAEAEFAGDHRVRVTQASALAHPHPMVPTARDGDGIVCER